MKAARAAWAGRMAGVRPGKLVFVDEFGAATNIQRTHGRAKGVRVVATVPRGHYKAVSTVAAMTVAGVVASASYDGGTGVDTFVAFVRQALVPPLRPGQVVVLDNLSAHHSPRVDELALRLRSGWRPGAGSSGCRHTRPT